MSEIFTDIFSWIESLNPLWTYLVIFAIAYGENIVPPIPGDMVIVFGGYLASTTAGIEFWAVWLLATVGGGLGFMSLYALGHSVGESIYSPDKYKWVPKDKMKTARSWIQKRGYWVVLANRFLSGTRSVISLVVGIAHMDPWRTALASTLSAFVWTGLITYGGYTIGENWEIMSEYLRLYGSVILVLMIAGAIVVFLGVRLRKKHGKQKKGEQK